MAPLFRVASRWRPANRPKLIGATSPRLPLVGEGRDQRLRDDLQRTAGHLARLPESRERVLLADPLLLHEQPLRALDRLPRREGLREGLGLLAKRAQLVVPRARRVDRRQQVLLAERLDEVAGHRTEGQT